MEPGQPGHDVTRILEAIQGGDLKAADELLPIVYEELRRLAAQKLSQEKPDQTLQATALVHEAYIRLVGSGDPGWNSRGHFFSAAAEAMRRILVERARLKRSVRRGGDKERVDLDFDDLPVGGTQVDLIALDQALDRLAETDRMDAELVKLRYFAGLTEDEVAQALGISSRTVRRRWGYARAGAGGPPRRGRGWPRKSRQGGCWSSRGIPRAARPRGCRCGPAAVR
jgi:RNA polymerase sigma factor (TIGR02999 family)